METQTRSIIEAQKAAKIFRLESRVWVHEGEQKEPIVSCARAMQLACADQVRAAEWAKRARMMQGMPY